MSETNAPGTNAPATPTSTMSPERRRFIRWAIAVGLVLFFVMWAKLAGLPAWEGFLMLGFAIALLALCLLPIIAIIMSAKYVCERTGSRVAGWIAGTVVTVICGLIYIGVHKIPVFGPTLTDFETHITPD
jgi:hypothetical protein